MYKLYRDQPNVYLNFIKNKRINDEVVSINEPKQLLITDFLDEEIITENKKDEN